MVSTLKVNKIQIPNSDSDVISLDASTGNIAFNKPVTGTAIVKVADLDFEDGVTACDVTSTHINSTYDSYKIKFRFKPATDNSDLRLRVLVNGELPSGSIYCYGGAAQDGNGYVSSNGQTYIRMANSNVGSDTGEGIMGEIDIYNVNSTFLSFAIHGFSNHFNTSGNHTATSLTGGLIRTEASTVVNGLRFTWSSGNAFEGTGNIKVYGIN